MKITATSTAGPPDPAFFLAELDASAQAAVTQARVVANGMLVAVVPQGRTGDLAKATKARTGRTPTGRSLTVGVPRNAKHGQVTAAKVARWVQAGTGVYRVGDGPKRPIRSRRPGGSLAGPGGPVQEVLGQRPNPYMARFYATADPAVTEILRQPRT